MLLGVFVDPWPKRIVVPSADQSGSIFIGILQNLFTRSSSSTSAGCAKDLDKPVRHDSQIFSAAVKS
jgi:hypothetical protein